MSTPIKIAEQFYSVQGEGPHAGVPSVFLRLAGCNLVCGGRENAKRDPEDMEPEGDATWVCDTIDVWREPERMVGAEELVEEWEARGWLHSLSESAHLVLTGGEPTMDHHQQSFLDLYAECLERDIVLTVEVETNGTNLPHPSVRSYVNQWNVSLKLSNSGMPEEKRINPEAIRYFKAVHTDSTHRDATFKFVASREEDVGEIRGLVEEYDIPEDMVMLMPAGQTQEQLRETYPIVAELCKEEGWRFTPRLQVDTWNQATGV